MKKETLVYLIGFMASGKSTVGKRLANTLGVCFSDVDNIIESQEGMPIWRIFEEKGEPYFRNLEKRELRTLTEQAPEGGIVIATGGGLPCNPDNLSFMKANGVVVYLKVEVNDIIGRIKKGKKRPVYQKLGLHGNLLENMERLLKERELYYAQADVTVLNSSGKDPKELTNEVIEALKGLSL